jgi:hypothetical protein
MRSDTHKVVVERPRRGGGGPRNQQAIGDFERERTRISVRRDAVQRGGKQTQNENPKPLEHFFESRAGKPLGGSWKDSGGSLDGRRRAASRQAAAPLRRNAIGVGRVRVQARAVRFIVSVC